MSFLSFTRSAALAASVALTPPMASAQGVPTIDTRSVLQQLQIYQQLLQDAGIQTEQLAKLVEQIKLFEKQLAKLEEIEAMLSDPTSVLSMALGVDLDGILEGELDVEMVGTILKGARGDWSDLSGSAGDFVAGVDRALEGAGTSQAEVTDLAQSGNPAAERNATATTTAAATSAAAEIAYEEAGQAVERAELMVAEIANMATLKESVDHNTRVTAELAIAMAALWQLESVQTMSDGMGGVLDAATIADIEKFTDFTQPDL